MGLSYEELPPEENRIEWAQPDRTHHMLDGFVGIPQAYLDPAARCPCVGDVWIQRQRPLDAIVARIQVVPEPGEGKPPTRERNGIVSRKLYGTASVCTAFRNFRRTIVHVAVRSPPSKAM